MKYDLFIIGGGSGGLRSARVASMLGKKVGLADFVKPSYNGNTWGLGGTCPNVGCIPKKQFHYSALCNDFIKDSRGAGWEIPENVQHNWKKMKDTVINNIKGTNKDIEDSLISQGTDYYNAFATIINKNTIKLVYANKAEKIITTDYIVIAVGGRPNYPPGVKNVKEYSITSDDLFFLEKLPKKVCVIGAGYISMECSGFLESLGAEVEVLVRSKILKEFDQEMVGRLHQFMERTIKFRFGASPVELNKKGDKIEVTIKNKDGSTFVESYDSVLCATGRKPYFLELGLENLKGVEYNRGKLVVNNESQINTEGNVFAVGDIVSNGLELTPIAIRQGQYLIEKLFGLEKDVEQIDYSIVPTTIFTPLEYSVCGITEEKAINDFGKENILVFNSTIKPIEWLFNDKFPGKRICYCKIITLKSEVNEELEKKIKERKLNDNPNNFYLHKIRYSKNKVLGVHYLGPHAGEIMQGYAVAMSQTTTYGDFIKTVAIHPVISETFVNLKSIKL